MKTCPHFSVNRNPFNPDLLTMMWFTPFSWWMGRILIRLTVTSWQCRLSERLSKKLYMCVMNAKNGPNINSALIIQGCCVMSDNYKGWEQFYICTLKLSIVGMTVHHWKMFIRSSLRGRTHLDLYKCFMARLSHPLCNFKLPASIKQLVKTLCCILHTMNIKCAQVFWNR